MEYRDININESFREELRNNIRSKLLGIKRFAYKTRNMVVGCFYKREPVQFEMYERFPPRNDDDDDESSRMLP